MPEIRELDPRDKATWPEFLTTAEVAVILAVDVQVVRRLVANGRLAGIRMGRGYRIPKQSLLDLGDTDDASSRS
jgi:excisionase family DNA binding protein